MISIVLVLIKAERKWNHIKNQLFHQSYALETKNKTPDKLESYSW